LQILKDGLTRWWGWEGAENTSGASAVAMLSQLLTRHRNDFQGAYSASDIAAMVNLIGLEVLGSCQRHNQLGDGGGVGSSTSAMDFAAFWNNDSADSKAMTTAIVAKAVKRVTPSASPASIRRLTRWSSSDE
jgi:hypothetical protein